MKCLFVKPLLAGYSGTCKGKNPNRNAKLCVHEPLGSTWATAIPARGPIMEGEHEEETKMTLSVTAW